MTYLYLFLGLVVIVAMAGMFMVGPDRGGPAAVIVPFTALAEGAQSEVSARVNYLITTPEELAELWKLLKEPPPPPTVDFDKNVVAAIFAGEVPTAGYSITVAEVRDTADRMVKVELTKPGEGCVLAQSVAAPYQIIELPKTSLPFTHEDIVTTVRCRQ